VPADLDDAEVIRRAGAARNGEKFRRLWSGDHSAYKSRSETDLALCGLIAFWVGPDSDRIDQLYRASGLYRPKWERDDYRQRTLDLVMQRTEYYTPRTSSARRGTRSLASP
jgi:putative DNA primase/helicase